MKVEQIDSRITNEEIIGKVFRCFKDDKSGCNRYLEGEGALVIEITENIVAFRNTTEDTDIQVTIQEFKNHFELYM